MLQLASGSNLGRYELLVPVARGGMADVWAARLRGTRGFTKLVAIKTLRAGSLDDKRLEQMLMAEAQLASLIQHPNVVSTLELCEQDGALFLVMEWADGEPLSFVAKETAESGGIPLPLCVNMIIQACNGLHCAHELKDGDGKLLGVVHRDISPQNVLLTYMGTVKVVDFGVAKVTERASSMTEDGEVKGKLAYMSPEQVKGEAIDRRTDIFAMGALLYLLTTGQHPFKGTNAGETLAELLSTNPVTPPKKLDPNYPDALQEVVLKALQKSPQQRFETAQAMSQALQKALPEAVGLESDAGEFLQKVSGKRGEQRRRQIRAAGELLDRGIAGLAVHPETQGALSSVSMLTGMQLTGSQLIDSQFTGTQSTLSPMQTPPKPIETHLHTGRSLVSWVAIAGLSLAGGAVAVFVLNPSDSQSAASAQAASPGFASTATVPGGPSAMPKSVSAQATSSVSAPAREPTELKEPSAEDEIKGAGSRVRVSSANTKSSRRVRRQRIPASPKKGNEVSAPAPSAAASAASAPKSGTSSKKKVNSWNPDEFGGRL